LTTHFARKRDVAPALIIELNFNHSYEGEPIFFRLERKILLYSTDSTQPVEHQVDDSDLDRGF